VSDRRGLHHAPPRTFGSAYVNSLQQVRPPRLQVFPAGRFAVPYRNQARGHPAGCRCANAGRRPDGAESAPWPTLDAGFSGPPTDQPLQSLSVGCDRGSPAEGPSGSGEGDPEPDRTRSPARTLGRAGHRLRMDRDVLQENIVGTQLLYVFAPGHPAGLISGLAGQYESLDRARSAVNPRPVPLGADSARRSRLGSGRPSPNNLYTHRFGPDAC